MYAGHAAIALALKAREPRVPLIVLALACYGPDWMEVALMLPHPREGMAPYTHSVPAVLVGAILSCALYAVVVGRSGALQILLGWLLHWPADLITGLKPIVGLNTLIGLDLYHAPLADFAVESAIVIVGCALYARTFARTARQRCLVIAMGTALAALQLGLDTVEATTELQPWGPKLADRSTQPHVERHSARSDQ